MSAPNVASQLVVGALMPWELPDEYCLVCRGSCMVPDVADGATLLFDRRAPYGCGDLVALYFAPGVLRQGEHQIWVKRLVLDVSPSLKFPFRKHPLSEIEPVVIAEQINPPRQMQIRASQLLGIHRCMGLVPSDRLRVRMSEQEIRALGRRPVDI